VSLICLENLCPLSAHMPNDRVVFTIYQGEKKRKKREQEVLSCWLVLG
jgi:hypothetical protein